jgi:hypothetical protein
VLIGASNKSLMEMAWAKGDLEMNVILLLKIK